MSRIPIYSLKTTIYLILYLLEYVVLLKLKNASSEKYLISDKYHVLEKCSRWYNTYR